jgi:hypothetical protein
MDATPYCPQAQRLLCWQRGRKESALNATFNELNALVAELTNWAETKGMFGDSRVDPGYDELVIQDTFRGAGLQSATAALQDRRISYIGLNEANSSVIVYVEKPLRKADRDALSNVGHGNCTVEFYNAGRLTSGGLPGNSANVPPYHQHNATYYTCGSSVSVANEASAGTLGCLLTDASGDVYALSNNHVFAGNNYCDIGIQIIAPGQVDIRANSLDPFTIGHLHKAIPLIDGNPKIVDASTNVDAAIIKISAPNRISSMQKHYYDTPATVMPISPNMVVEKVGRTTGRTTGVVTSYHTTPQFIRCNISRHNTFKIVHFQDFWGVRSQSGAFSSGGDSGSLVTTVDPHGVRSGVGLVFAGIENINLSLIIPLDKVLGHFGLTLLANHNI